MSTDIIVYPRCIIDQSAPERCEVVKGPDIKDTSQETSGCAARWNENSNGRYEERQEKMLARSPY